MRSSTALPFGLDFNIYFHLSWASIKFSLPGDWISQETAIAAIPLNAVKVSKTFPKLRSKRITVIDFNAEINEIQYENSRMQPDDARAARLDRASVQNSIRRMQRT